MPLLEGLDGVEKMSKSKNNYIGIAEPPEEMFGKIMKISDELMWRYYELVSIRTRAEIDAFKREMAQGRNPRDIKVLLGQEIVARFHSPRAADQALRDFEARFRQGEAPEQMPHFTFALQGKAGIAVSALLKQAGLAPSGSEAIRAIEQGGVRIDGQRVEDRSLVLATGTYLLQLGKRRWARVTLT
jgi:tyrosyl-tRNA synthetase